MTIKEIAKLAGVSPSTVSRVLNINDSSAASIKTRERIWEIVRENNYIPNVNARNLKTPQVVSTKSKTLACIFARTTNIKDEPFFSKIANSAEIEALKMGYLVKYYFTSVELSSATIEKLLTDVNVDGIIILGKFNKNLISTIRKHCKNIVYAAINTADFDLDQVVCDGRKAAITAVEYLHKMGHRRIGFVGDANDDIRFKGYADALRLLGLPVNFKDVVNCRLTSEAAQQTMLRHIDENTLPSAFFCCNDVTAIGVIRALKERKIAIPNDISIISIDDIELAGQITPALTTIGIPKQEIGKMAARTLISRIENRHRLHMKIELPFQLVKRDSVKKVVQ